MLPAQVVVNLLLKLSDGVDPTADYQCLERSSPRGEHSFVGQTTRAVRSSFVHSWNRNGISRRRTQGRAQFNFQMTLGFVLNQSGDIY
jgi:hypothetical protein